MSFSVLMREEHELLRTGHARRRAVGVERVLPGRWVDRSSVRCAPVASRKRFVLGPSASTTSPVPAGEEPAAEKPAPSVVTCPSPSSSSFSDPVSQSTSAEKPCAAVVDGRRPAVAPPSGGSRRLERTPCEEGADESRLHCPPVISIVPSFLKMAIAPPTDAKTAVSPWSSFRRCSRRVSHAKR